MLAIIYRNLITTNSTNTGCAGVLLPYHPLKQFQQYNNSEVVFKNACCQVGWCSRYYKARISDNGSNYDPPMKGMIHTTCIYIIVSCFFYANTGRKSIRSSLLHSGSKILYL